MASSSGPKGCEMQQSIDEDDHKLEEFVKYFVKEFETKLTAYHLILEGENKEKRESSNTFSEALGQAAGGLACGIVGYFAGAIGAGISAGTAAGGRVGSIVGNEMHLKKVNKLADVVDLFLKDKAGFRIKLVEAGYDIFQSFEMQFNRVSVDHRKAFQLLARDAMNRAIDYFKKNKDASVTEGVVYGKSKTEPVLCFPIPKTPGFKIYYEYKDNNHKWSTSSLYEKVGLVIEAKDSSETAIYYERKKNGKSRTKKYGYRHLFTSESWEKMKEEYVISNVEKSEQFTGYRYILKPEDSKEKINDILNKINMHDSTLEGERLTEIMREVKGEIEEVIHVLKERTTQSEEDHEILERIEAGVRNLNVNDYLKQFELYSKQTREECLKIAKSIEASREENEKYYDQLNKKRDIHHGDNKREHEKTQDMVQRVKQGLDSSGKKIDEIHKVIVPQPNLKKESIWFDIRQPVQQFTGRKKELSDLHSKIQRSSGKLTVISQMTSISGLGGIGKTELARQYILEHKEDYGDVIWINAENEDTLWESFMRLATDYLGIKTKNADGERKDEKSIICEIFKYFERRTSLFIFDNAENHKYLYDFLPLHCTKADAKIPYILFTSRIREWEKGIQVILLNELKLEEAMEFIKNGLGIKDASQDKEIKELTEKLQYFPLAIQQAISYIEDQMKTGDYGISNYLKEYEKRSGKLLESKVFQGIDNHYTKTTVTTWNITLDNIENDKEHGQLAVKILYIMAYLSPEKIDRKLFLNLANGNEKLLASVVSLLVKYSMVNGEQQQSVLSIHRLVQEIIRLELKRQGREEENLREALELIRVNLREEILEHTYTLQKYVPKFGELEKILRNLHHFAMNSRNSKCKSSFELLELPDKLKWNLMILAENIPPKVKQERAYKYLFHTCNELSTNMEEFFGINMNVGEIEMEHAWQFEEDKDVHGNNPEVLEWRNRTCQLLSKGSALCESEKYKNQADLNVKDTYGNTSLHLASAKGQIDTIRCLIDREGADFEAKNNLGQNPLHFAAANGHLDVVEYLINEKNAAFDVPDYYHFTPLYLAAWNGKLNVVKYLVDGKGAKIDYFDGKPIDYLVKQGYKNVHATNINCTQKWLPCLQDLHATTSMHLAALRGHLDILKYFIDVKGANSNAKNIFGSTPLHSASQNGHLETVEYLVHEKGVNVNDKNAFHSTPVHLAAQNGHLETLKYLINDKKADFDIINQLSIFPVHLAAKNGHVDVLKYLIGDLEARSNIVDFEGNTPLHFAALNGHLAIVEYLIDKKNADVNITNASSDTPLHLAAFNGHLDVVKCLIDQKKTEFNNINVKGETPLHLAAINGHLLIVQYLIEEKNADFNNTYDGSNIYFHQVLLNCHYDIVHNIILKNENFKGDTILHIAALITHYALEECNFDEKDAYFNITNANNDTPLHLAAANGHLAIVKYFIDKKVAEFNIINANCDTPLHLAAANGHLAIVKYLIDEKKADFNITNANSDTPFDFFDSILPFDLAATNGHLAITDYFFDEKNADF